MNKYLYDLPEQFESQRLLIRSYAAGDGPTLYAVMLNNHDHLQRFESGNVILTIHSIEEAEICARDLHADWVARNCFFMGAFDKWTGKFVAQVYVGPLNWDSSEFVIGYFVDKDHEGQGYVTEAVKAALNFIFTHLKAHRFRLDCDEANTRSQGVAERCGFTREGLSRQNKRQPDGTFSNTLHYGLLREDWLKQT